MDSETKNPDVQKTQMHTTKHPFFPADYLIMTVTSLIFLGAASSLGAFLVDYWFNGVSGGIFTDLRLLGWLAALAVVTPVHLWSYTRVRRTDRRVITSFSIRVAHGLLGIYLLVTIGTAIILSIWLVTVWLNAFLGTGSIDKHLLVASLALVQAITWSMYATVHFIRARIDKSRPKYYVFVISFLCAALITLGLVFPARAYRSVARDFVKEADLVQIQQAVSEYVDDHEALPANIAELSAPKDVSKRLNDYHYTPKGESSFGAFGYELCATFTKSAGDGKDAGIGFGSHAVGRQCFSRFTVSGTKLQQDLSNYVKNVENGEQKLRQALGQYLGVALGQVHDLEGYLEGLENSTTVLQREMGRLEGNLTGLEGDTGQLAQDFADVEQFFHNLLCGLTDSCSN